MILTIIAIVAGIGIKVRNFLKQSKEDQKKQLQKQADKVVELVKESLLSIVSKAEKEWGSGTGTIKKSWVWEQLQAQQQKLTGRFSMRTLSSNCCMSVSRWSAVATWSKPMEKSMSCITSLRFRLSTLVFKRPSLPQQKKPPTNAPIDVPATAWMW